MDHYRSTYIALLSYKSDISVKRVSCLQEQTRSNSFPVRTFINNERKCVSLTSGARY